LEGVPCWIIAEGGVCYREPNATDEDAWINAGDQDKLEWKAPVKEIMEYFAARTPGSNVIEMEASVSWFYQNMQGDHAAIQSKDLLVHLWAGPLTSAPAEVVVEKDAVTVRPTGIGKATQLEKILHQICVEDALHPKTTFVTCIGDFLMRDEDIFATCRSFFETDRGPDPQDGEDDQFGGMLWSTAIQENEVSQLRHLEVNSLSLGSGFHFNATHRLVDDDSPGAGDGQLDVGGARGHGHGHGHGRLLKKTPSEPGADERGTTGNHSEPDGWHQQDHAERAAPPAIFTCTVNRKATRAAYHLSDTNDVAFLMAQLARELRSQAKLAAESEQATPIQEQLGDPSSSSHPSPLQLPGRGAPPPSLASLCGGGGGGGGSSGGYATLASLFDPLPR